jgi:hypothetical protein
MSKKPAVAAKAAPRKRVTKPKEPRMDFPLKNIPNWEKLCKQLQEALAKEMRENDDLRAELERKRSFFERLVCLTTGTV